VAFKFTVFDGGIKKIALYQQYFVVKSTWSGSNNSTGKGGARAASSAYTGVGQIAEQGLAGQVLALDPGMTNPACAGDGPRRWESSCKNTFAACGVGTRTGPTSARNLLEKWWRRRRGIDTTLHPKSARPEPEKITGRNPRHSS
jgi:type I restriction enzyme R subunit